MISDEIFLAISHSCDFEDYTFNDPHNESKSCNDAIAEANSVVGDYVNNYDVILDVCYPSIVMQELRLREYVCYCLLLRLRCSSSFDWLFLVAGDEDQYWRGCLHVLREVFLLQSTGGAAGSAC
jgi:hypothetical protein